MRIEQLEYIVETSKHKSLSKAAKQLFITHAALSTSITNLENELQLKIFNRSNNGIHPTEEGKEIIQSAHKILDEISYMKAFNQHKEHNKQTLKIVAISTIANNVLIKPLTDFQQLYPHCSVILDEVFPNDVPLEIHNESAHIGVSYVEEDLKGQFQQQCRQYDLCWEEVYLDSLCAYVSNENELAKKSSLTKADLSHCLSATLNHRLKKSDMECYQNSIDNDFSLSFRSQESLKKFILESNAIAYFPKLLSFNDYYVTSGAIVPLDLIDYHPKLHHYIVYAKKLTLTNELSELINVIKSRYQDIKEAMKNS